MGSSPICPLISHIQFLARVLGEFTWNCLQGEYNTMHVHDLLLDTIDFLYGFSRFKSFFPTLLSVPQRRFGLQSSILQALYLVGHLQTIHFQVSEAFSTIITFIFHTYTPIDFWFYLSSKLVQLLRQLMEVHHHTYVVLVELVLRIGLSGQR